MLRDYKKFDTDEGKGFFGRSMSSFARSLSPQGLGIHDCTSPRDRGRPRDRKNESPPPRDKLLLQKLEDFRQRNDELEQLLAINRVDLELFETTKALLEASEAELEATKLRNQDLDNLLAASRSQDLEKLQDLDAVRWRSKELEEALAKKQAELEANKQCTHELEKSIAASQVDVQRYAGLSQELDAFKQRNEELERALATSPGDVKRYSDSFQGLSQDRDTTKQRNEELEKALAVSMQELKASKEHNDELEKAFALSRQELQQSLAANQALAQELKASKEHNEERETRLHAPNKSNQDLQKLLSASQAEVQRCSGLPLLLEATKRRNDELKQSLAALQAEIQGSQKELNATKQRNKELEMSLAASQANVQELEHHHEAIQGQIQGSQEELEATKQRHQELENPLLDSHAHMQCYTGLLQELEKLLSAREDDVKELDLHEHYAGLKRVRETTEQHHEELGKVLASPTNADKVKIAVPEVLVEFDGTEENTSPDKVQKGQERYHGLLQELGSTKKRNQELEKSLAASQADVKELKTALRRVEIHPVKAALQQLEESADGVGGRQKHIEIFYAEMMSKCDRLESECLEFKKKVQLLEADAVKKNSRILSLRQALAIAEEKPSLKARAKIVDYQPRNILAEVQDQAATPPATCRRGTK